MRKTNPIGWQLCALGLWLVGSQCGKCFWNPELPSGNAGSGMETRRRDSVVRHEPALFGECLCATGPSGNARTIRLSGECRCDKKDSVYPGYRFYNPRTGRWLTRDPISEKSDKNLFVFVHNNATGGVDRLGLCECKILSPLSIQLSPPRAILGPGSYSGPPDQAVWDGQLSRVWFTMRAKFANACCKFRQRLRSIASVGGRPVEDTGWTDDTDYENGKYETQPDGSVDFSDWDNPGWEQALVNPKGENFIGAKFMEGYVVDDCNPKRSHVGPILFYGINVSGAPPSISVTPYGFR